MNQAGLGHEIELKNPHLSMTAVGYGTVREVYPGAIDNPESEWRATIEPAYGGLVEHVLIIGNKKPYPHQPGRPSYVIYGYFNGDFRQPWCSPNQQMSMSDKALLRSGNTYFEQIGKVLWRTDLLGNLYLEDWVVVPPPPVLPLLPGAPVRLPDIPAPAGDAPAPVPTPGLRNILIKVNPTAYSVDFWEAATLAAVPLAVVRFFGGTAKIARLGDSTMSDTTTDSVYWTFWNTVWAAFNVWSPALDPSSMTLAAAIKAAIITAGGSAPPTLTSKITSGSDRVKIDPVTP